MSEFIGLHGLVPAALAPATRRIILEDFDLPVDIGFHAFEIGTPQRLRINVEVWLDAANFPQDDRVDAAWDYDSLRTGIVALVAGHRFNRQETVCRRPCCFSSSRRISDLRAGARLKTSNTSLDGSESRHAATSASRSAGWM